MMEAWLLLLPARTRAAESTNVHSERSDIHVEELNHPIVNRNY
jgi:hypothetical protein